MTWLINIRKHDILAVITCILKYEEYMVLSKDAEGMAV